MKDNPFTSQKFVNVWSRHFNKAKTPFSFKFLNNVKFLKYRLLPLYINIGENLTKGIYYTLNLNETDYKGKTFLIYDVPSYFHVDEFKTKNNTSLKLKKIFQYQGFLMDITSYSNKDDYINDQFSSKNRREFKSNQRRLETCFNISYCFIHDAISKEKFDLYFSQFYDLLNKRFSDKQTNYHHLNPKKWHFYEELVFEMLKEKKASLLIIYNDNVPIGITLNFHSEDILFETITVFDSDYYKFSIGKTSIIKLLEWCFENNFKMSDFSKGDFDYKRKWGNVAYDFHYHIFYDKSSIKSRLTAIGVSSYFKTKLFLRDKNLNTLYRKGVYYLKGNKNNLNNDMDVYNAENITEFKATSEFEQVNYKKENYTFLLQPLYVFLFANPESIANIKIYKNKTIPKLFVIKGTKNAQKVTFI